VGPTVCLNPLEKKRLLSVPSHWPICINVRNYYIPFSFCSGFYPNLPHLSHFLCLLFLSQIFLSMLFANNISYSIYFVSIFPSVFFKFPAIHGLLFLYSFIYFSFFITFFLACFLYACSSRVSMLHTFFPPRDSPVLSQPPNSAS